MRQLGISLALGAGLVWVVACERVEEGELLPERPLAQPNRDEPTRDEPARDEPNRGEAARTEPGGAPSSSAAPTAAAAASAADSAPAAAASAADAPAAAEPAVAPPERVQPVVLVLAVGVDCAPTTVPFEPGSAELDAADRVALTALALCLEAAPDGEPIAVVRLPARDEPEPYDSALATERATRIAAFLRLSGAPDASYEIRPVGADGEVATMPVLHPRSAPGLAARGEPTSGGEPAPRSVAKPGTE